MIRRPNRTTLMCLGALFVGLIAGCGGGGGGTSSGGGTSAATSDTGKVAIGLTDADGDFLRYQVDVQSVRLTKASGAVVDALPQTTTVDFAQLTDLAEFVSAATIPAGRYTAASLVLDYSNADIEVEVSGTPVQATPVLPGGGTILEVEVRFGNSPLVVNRGKMSHLTLDFDLAQSNVVTLGTPPTVEVQPFLAASMDFASSKEHRLRGLLQSVDTASGTFTLSPRPFETPMPEAEAVGSMGHGSGDHMDSRASASTTEKFGQISVSTDDQTTFEIDGVSSHGAEGLAALAAEPADTPVVAFVNLDASTRSIVATEVYAAASVPGIYLDAVTGTVVARSGDTLTVRRAMAEFMDGSSRADQQVQVLLSDTTRVTREGDGSEVQRTIQEISVGQKVAALGTLSGTDGSYTLDATQGLVRLLVTGVSGTVLESQAGAVTISVQQIEGLGVDRFDFTGTGSDPSRYVVDTGTLPVEDLVAGSPVRLLGFVAPFQSAPPDFEAVTVVRLAGVVGRLQVSWSPPASDGVSASDASLTLQVGSDAEATMYRGGTTEALTGTVTVVPASTRGTYWLRSSDAMTRYTDFADLTTGVQTALTSGGKVASLAAVGTFDDATETLSANSLILSLEGAGGGMATPGDAEDSGSRLAEPGPILGIGMGGGMR